MDIYAKFDVIVSSLVVCLEFLSLQNLAAERTYNNLDVSLNDALKHRAGVREGSDGGPLTFTFRDSKVSSLAFPPKRLRR